MASYEKLSVVDKARVNGVIIGALSSEKNEAFVNGFRQQIKDNSPAGDRVAGFQATLDNLRAVLADDIKNLPPLKQNNIDDKNDLGAQTTLLRNLRDVMAREKPNQTYSPAQIRETINNLKKTSHGEANITFADSARPYEKESELLAKSAARAAIRGKAPAGKNNEPEPNDIEPPRLPPPPKHTGPRLIV